MAQKKILIVEDNNAILDVITLILEGEEHLVEGLSSGSTILSKIETFKPNLLILDIMLPDIDGRLVLKKLKADNQTKHIPVIMISAKYNLDNYFIDGIKADDFMAKPFDINDLISKINALI